MKATDPKNKNLQEEKITNTSQKVVNKKTGQSGESAGKEELLNKAKNEDPIIVNKDEGAEFYD